MATYRPSHGGDEGCEIQRAFLSGALKPQRRFGSKTGGRGGLELGGHLGAARSRSRSPGGDISREPSPSCIPFYFKDPIKQRFPEFSLAALRVTRGFLSTAVRFLGVVFVFRLQSSDERRWCWGGMGGERGFDVVGGALAAFHEVTAAPLFPFPSSRNDFVFPLPPNPLSVSPRKAMPVGAVGPSSSFLPLHRLYILISTFAFGTPKAPTLNARGRE